MHGVSITTTKQLVSNMCNDPYMYISHIYIYIYTVYIRTYETHIHIHIFVICVYIYDILANDFVKYIFCFLFGHHYL